MAKKLKQSHFFFYAVETIKFFLHVTIVIIPDMLVINLIY